MQQLLIYWDGRNAYVNIGKQIKKTMVQSQRQHHFVTVVSHVVIIRVDFFVVITPVAYRTILISFITILANADQMKHMST